MKRLASASAVLLTAVLTQPAVATPRRARTTTADRRRPRHQIRDARQCRLPAGQNRCTFNTTANLLTPDGPTGFPGDVWARQTTTLRSSDRLAWEEASYSCTCRHPRETKGANHDNVLSKLFKSTTTLRSR